MIYSDIIKYNIAGDTKFFLLRCILFISKVKNGHIISTLQYMNYQSFRNLQFKLKKKLFPQHKNRTKGYYRWKNSFCVRRNYTSCSLVSQDFGYSFLLYTSYEMVAQSSANFPIFVDMQDCVEELLVLLHNFLGELKFPLLKIYCPSCKKKSEQIFLKLLLQRLEKLSVDEKTQNNSKRCWNNKFRTKLGGGKKKSKRRTRWAISRKSSSKICRSRKDIFDKIKWV